MRVRALVGVATVVVFGGLASSASAVSFSPATGSPFGSLSMMTPVALATGDFNGDTIPDLVTANNGGNNLTTLTGNGTGGFTVGPPISSQSGPSGVAVADFDGDGDQDLVDSASPDNQLVVLLNNGSGGFPTPGNIFSAGGNNPSSVATGDVNGDGKPDIVAPVLPGNVSVFLGSGTGTFSAASGSPVSIGAYGVSILLADLNGDGKPDIATSNSDNTVTILLGSGTGTFTQASGSPFVGGNTPVKIATGDFNADGKPDLATANRNGNDVSVFLGNGAGQFTAAAGSPFSIGGNVPTGVTVADFNGDGNVDLATSNESDHAVSVLLGDGAGAFTAAPGSPFSLGGGIFPESVLAGDWNGDGRPDFATSNLSNNVSSLLNTTTFPAPPAADSVLVDELRFTGPSGTGDQFVKLFNTSSTTAQDVGGWTVAGSNSRNVSIPYGTVIPPLGYLVLTGPWNLGTGYSLNTYGPSTLPLPYGSSGSLRIPQATGGVRLLSPDSTAIDAAGFVGAGPNFREGAGIAQPPAFSGDQISWVRKTQNGAPVDTGDNASDFLYVDAGSGAADPSFGTPIGGAPAPAGLQSPTTHNDILQSGLLDPGVDDNASPNQIAGGGFVTFNRKLTNCSGQLPTGACANASPGTAQTVTRLRFRISLLTTDGNSAGGAILRGTNVPAQTNLPISGGGTADVPAMTLDVPPSATNRGGIGSSWTDTVNLPGGGLAPGASINVGFRFVVVQTGGFNFGYQAEDDLVPAKENATPPPTQQQPPPQAEPVAPVASGTITPAQVAAPAVTGAEPIVGPSTGSTPTATAKKVCKRVKVKRAGKKRTKLVCTTKKTKKKTHKAKKPKRKQRSRR
jgi:hypothetical protein